QVVRPDRFDDPHDLLRREVDVVLERECHAVLLGGLRRLLQHRHDPPDQLFARRLRVVHARRADAHSRRAELQRLRDVTDQRLELLRLRAAPEAFGMTPTEHAVDACVVEAVLQLAAEAVVERVEEARLERHLVDVLCEREVEKLALHPPPHAGVRLQVRVDLAEVAVEAIAVDSDVHRATIPSCASRTRSAISESSSTSCGVISTSKTSSMTHVQPWMKYRQPSSTWRRRAASCRTAWWRKSSSPR